MDYEGFFKERLAALRAEGRYCIVADAAPQLFFYLQRDLAHRVQSPIKLN
jgi:hypothetical protein